VLHNTFQFTAFGERHNWWIMSERHYGAFKPYCERFTVIPNHLQSIKACHHHLPRFIITVVTSSAVTDHRS